MSLAPAITDVEQLKNHPAVARLLSWKHSAIQRIYYAILIVFSLFGVVAIRAASPLKLFTILANIAGMA